MKYTALMPLLVITLVGVLIIKTFQSQKHSLGPLSGVHLTW